MCVPHSQKENLSVIVDISKLNMKSVMWLQKKNKIVPLKAAGAAVQREQWLGKS